MTTELLNNLMMICLHAPKNLSQLKCYLPPIVDIWESNSKRGRYSQKWVAGPWPAVLDEMAELEKEWMAEMISRVNYSTSEIQQIVNDFDVVDML